MKEIARGTWNIPDDGSWSYTNCLFETANEKYCVCYFDIGEYGMMRFASPVQIWTDKARPRLLFKSQRLWFNFWSDECCYFLPKSDIIILMALCYKDNVINLPYILLDLNKEQFAVLNHHNYVLTEIEAGHARLDLHPRYTYDEQQQQEIAKHDGEEIRLADMDWYDLRDVDRVCKMI